MQSAALMNGLHILCRAKILNRIARDPGFDHGDGNPTLMLRILRAEDLKVCVKTAGLQHLHGVDVFHNPFVGDESRYEQERKFFVACEGRWCKAREIDA